MNRPLNPDDLIKQIQDLENENASLRKLLNPFYDDAAVKVPPELQPVFHNAQQTVSNYFRNLKLDHTKGTIEINDQRYVLVRASAFSKAFLETIQRLYADKGEREAFAIGRNFLFDYAHVIGMNDARNFHLKMKLNDPIEKLSAGPVHFAFSGWAFVDISPDSNPTPDDNFVLYYTHPYSFEADSWVSEGRKSTEPVCIMNAGYSSGWCEESFGMPLTAVEVKCMAKGDDRCQFIMSPPDKIHEHLARLNAEQEDNYVTDQFNIPTFFDRKRVEEEMERSRILAEESAQAKSDFIANMSHELRTPLGAILGFTELLKKTNLDNLQQDYLQAIDTSGTNLLSIINNVLDLSKIDAGKFPLENILFSIPELMHSVQMMLSSQAALKGLRFTTSVDTAIDFQVTGDPTRLTQILINLIGNAIKFTDTGGVYVNCIVENQTDNHVELCFSVRDTGIGISPEKIDTIFERFTQADSNINRKYGGTGLGLAITRQLVELQGGTICAKSNNNETEFSFTLSYPKAGRATLTTSNTPAIAASHARGSQVLIVDDNVMNRKLTSTILANNGFIPTLAENGTEAIDLMKRKTFDHVLMDIQMPGIDGYTTAGIIRNELKLATPLIAMTAHALSGERERCIAAGFNDYLAKPFRESQLLEMIARLDEGTIKDAGLIDLSFLMAQSRNNMTFVTEMTETFLEHAPLDFDRLKIAAQKADFTGIYKATHSLRNCIALFGLDKHMGNELAEIEKLAMEGTDITRIKALLPGVTTVFEQALEEFKALKN